MGSGQSAAHPKDTNKTNKSTFAIDLDAKADQPTKSSKKQKKKKRANGSRKSTDPNQEAKMTEASQQQQQSPRHPGESPAPGLVPLVAMAEFSEAPSGLPQLVVLNNLPKAQPKNSDDGFSLNELDAILERMKAKYRPGPVELYGNRCGVFEEIERNLVNCYSKHKDQPLECSKLAREYTAFVFEQRNRILRDATRKDSPLYT